ncbi:A/G-specific adenine glycosylase [Sphingomonas sp. F9_3S_D5_B_2]
MTANAATRLLQHYVDNFRRLPWRSGPGEAPPDPYRVWLSEVMLQQTTVAAVTPRFQRFVARWPTVQALAAALDDEVLSEWAGLGYYARARNLIACAREVVRRGGLPSTAAELRTLPGLGDYTAGAIAAIAFGEAVAVVDTNVRRVVARLNAIREPTPAQISALVETMVPANQPGDFAQAMMDLGATICRAKAPLCQSCPLAGDCKARASGQPAAFPAAKSKAPRPHRHAIAWWTQRDGTLWLVRRPGRGILGGMAALPTSEWQETAPANAVAVVRHVFTHFSLDLHVVPAGGAVGEGWWQPLERIDEAGLPTLYRKAVAAAQEGERLLAA